MVFFRGGLDGDIFGIMLPGMMAVGSVRLVDSEAGFRIASRWVVFEKRDCFLFHVDRVGELARLRVGRCQRGEEGRIGAAGGGDRLFCEAHSTQPIPEAWVVARGERPGQVIRASMPRVP